MVKVPIPIEEVMSNANLSITSSPFSPGKMIIKRASFKAGETPEHLKQFELTGNEGQQGAMDTVVVDGKPIPKSAAKVKESRDANFTLD